jgi:hypothetical protein
MAHSVSDKVTATKINLELMDFRIRCSHMPQEDLNKLFNRLSARRNEADLIPAEKEILQAKINIVGMSKNLNGRGAQG